MAQKYKRRKYIINAAFQWKFVLGFVVITLIGSVVSTVLFNYFANQKLDELQWSIHLSVTTLGEALRPYFIYTNLFTLLFVLMTLVVAGAWMIHRMNNPVSQFIRRLEDICRGNLATPFTLGALDEFHDVADALNDMLDIMRTRFDGIKREYADLSDELIDYGVDHEKRPDDDERRERLISMVKKLQEKTR